jgi:hypothetical protein
MASIEARVSSRDVERDALIARVEALESVVAEQGHRIGALERARCRLSRGDHLALARLLPVIVGVYGSETFTARDLTTDPAAGIRIVVGDRSAKSLGRLLARAAEAGAIDGLLVERAGQQINVTGWRVVASVSSH